MDIRHIEALTELFANLDCSLAKGIGDCLQVTARMAMANLEAADNRSIKPKSDTDTGHQPTHQVHPSKPENAFQAFDEEDEDFFSSETRTVSEVAEYIHRGRTFVLTRIGTSFTAETDDKGHYQVYTDSVRKFLLESENGRTSEEEVGVYSSAKAER